jgi:hypothetical protein
MKGVGTHADARRDLMMRSSGLFFFVIAVGCGTSTQTPVTTSKVTGSLTAASFPAAPTAVEAIDETGAKLQAPTDAQGNFQLVLAKGHTYRFAVVLGSGSEPVVFPRASKRLDTTVRISSGAATIALGAIRHLNAAPVSGFTVKTASTGTKPQTENAGEGNDGECVNGVIEGTGAACVDDDGKASCDSGNDNGADGECENGKDAKTGAPCTDAEQGAGDGETDDDATAADPTKPMAVPDHNAPDNVAGCNEGGDGDGETNDD